MRPSALSLAFALSLLASCGPGERPGDAGEPGGTVIIAVPSAFAPALPQFATNATTVNIVSQVYDRLAQIPADLNTFGDRGYEPRIARSWSWAPDSLSITFALDPEARWHDGKPVRASDVRFSLELAKDSLGGSAVAPLLTNVDSISVRDSLTAVAWFRQRTPEQFYELVYSLYVVPEHVLAGVPRAQLATTDASRLLVGSGRFRFGRFEPGVRLELVADTANFRGRARLDRVIFTAASDAGAAIAQLLSGQADVYEFLPPDVVARLDTASPARAVPAPALGFTFMGMNMRAPGRAAPHPVFADRAVRRAISMALDREAMLRNVFDTLGVLGTGPYARPMADPGVEGLPYDRARAAALLDSAGWRPSAGGVRSRNGRPLAFSVMFPTSSRPRQRYAVLIQEQLKAIGARVDLTGLDFPTFMSRQTAGNFDAALMSMNPDPSLGGARQYWTTSAIGGGGQNYVRYSNPRFDALLDSAITSFDPGGSRAIARRAFQVLIDDAPAVWLYDLVVIHGIHRRIRPTDMRADGWWAGLADWTIPAEQRIDRDRIGMRPAQP